MKNILLISATSGNNYKLALELEDLLKTKEVNYNLIKLDDFSVPLYNPKIEKTTKSDDISKLDELFQNADGFIFCAPEYNGSTPPILTNVIAWISVKTSNWRGAFNGKSALICTHSGGVGNNFINSLRIQLNHLGVIVLPRAISKTDDSPLKKDSVSKILDQLISIT